MLLVPMFFQEEAIGFLGFDSVKAQKTWTDESIHLLKIVGELFVNALQQKRSQEELQHAYQTLEQRVQERTQELQILLDFAAATNSSLSMDTHAQDRAGTPRAAHSGRSGGRHAA